MEFDSIREMCVDISERLKAKKAFSTIVRRDGGTYLHRSYILQDLLQEDTREERASMFLHQFVGDDPYDEVHTHPWEWGVAIILDNAYQETRYQWNSLSDAKVMPPPGAKMWLRKKRVKTFKQFDVNIIRHHEAHRVMLVDGKPVWTLFIHGRRVSEWGFFKEQDGIFRMVKGRTSDNTNDANAALTA